MQAMLEMRGISKSYGDVLANRHIDLTVRPGEIVGLLGENGSGKSTLMKILFGMVRPDEGGIVYQGRELSIGSPKGALEAGIAMIHQHFTLVEAMTVTENLMLGQASGRWLDHAGMARQIREAGERYGLSIDPHVRVENLALGEKQRVEILKAILRGADLLILDEPTSILSPPEIAQLLGFLKRFRAENRSVIFITHKLGEVLDVADHVVVLRDGQVVGAQSTEGATRQSLARLMVGREASAAVARSDRKPGPERLRVVHLGACDADGVPRLQDVSFSLRAGEVLALAGIDGNGQGELADTLAGLTRASSGMIYLDGQDITRGGAKSRLDAGIAYLPADRAGTSLVQQMSIEDNLMLRDFDRRPYSAGGLLARKTLRLIAATRIKDFNVRTASASAAARTLSGGNQQKVALAREIGRKPEILIVFQPTWGLDPESTQFVIRNILALRNAGGAVLYISSELEEVLALGDRIAVMSEGRIVEMLDRDDADMERIGLALAGSANKKAA